MKTSENWDNPYRVSDVPLEPERGLVVPRSGYFWIAAGMWLQLLTVIVGLGFARWKVDSIVGTGPILSILGIVLAILSYRKGLLSGVLLGLSAPAFSVMVFLIIFLQNWSPHDAQQPVPVIIGIYLLAVLSTGLLMLTQIRRRQQAAQVDVSPESTLLDPSSGFRL